MRVKLLKDVKIKEEVFEKEQIIDIPEGIADFLVKNFKAVFVDNKKPKMEFEKPVEEENVEKKEEKKTYEEMTRSELVKILQEKGIEAKGSKSQLIKKLKEVEGN